MLISKLYQPQKLQPTQILDSFRSDVATNPDVELPTRNQLRGYLYSKDFGETLEFQFNPTDMQINKRHVWEYRSYVGRNNVDPIWIRGDVKTLSFTLFFEASAGAQIVFNGGKVLTARGTSLNTAINDQKNAMPARGTLDQIETLEKFSYPLPDDLSKPRFVNSVAILNTRFNTVPTLDFVYGPMFIKCKLTELTYKHQAFNKALIPIQSEAEVTITIIEGLTVVNSQGQASPGSAGLLLNAAQ